MFRSVSSMLLSLVFPALIPMACKQPAMILGQDPQVSSTLKGWQKSYQEKG
jgi:hypothetical protein